MPPMNAGVLHRCYTEIRLYVHNMYVVAMRPAFNRRVNNDSTRNTLAHIEPATSVI